MNSVAILTVLLLLQNPVHYYLIMSLNDWIQISDLINKIVATVAILVGGWWVLFRFGKDRTYRPKLELKVSGKIECKNGSSYLSVTYELKSMGSPKTSLDERSGLLIFSSQPSGQISEANTVAWKPESAHDVFEKHRWIEHYETVVGAVLVALPSCDQLAYRLELTVFADNLEWNTEAIIFNELRESEKHVYERRAN